MGNKQSTVTHKSAHGTTTVNTSQRTRKIDKLVQRAKTDGSAEIVTLDLQCEIGLWPLRLLFNADCS